jgi:hypothetical protein
MVTLIFAIFYYVIRKGMVYVDNAGKYIPGLGKQFIITPKEIDIELLKKELPSGGGNVPTDLIEKVSNASINIGNITELGTSPRALTTSLSEKGLNIRDFSASANGTDDSSAFDRLLYTSSTTRIKVVYIPDGVYGITRTIVVPKGVRMVFAPNAIVKPLANVNIFQMKPLAAIDGATVDLRNMPTWSKAVFYYDAVDVFQFYEQSHSLDNINIMGAQKTSGWLGTGIFMEAKTLDSYIDNVKCNNITMTNIGKGIHLRVDPSVKDMNRPSWVNANMFHEITIMNFEYGIYLEGDNAIPRDVGGNIFTQLQLQAEVGTKRMIYCESALNRFDGFFWDLHKMKEENAAFEFTATAKFNEIKSAMAQELTESWIDKGYMNGFPSPNNYVADKRINAMPISLPYVPNFLGNQDDWMVNGNLRGFTVAQTSTHKILAGQLSDIFSFDTESGVTFDMTNATYENPVVIEIDLSTDPCFYAAFLTVMNPWGEQPKGYTMSMYDDITKKWTEVHWTKSNTSQAIAVSPPYSMSDKCTKIRIAMWGYNKTTKKVTISRVMMTSTKDGGKAYLPYTSYSPTAAANVNITPILPNDKSMSGDQDDILHLADKHYKVTSLGAVKTAGNLWGMFSLRREQFCRWTNPTAAVPIVIEIDFGTTGIPSMESVGVAFGWDETPTNIKIERVINSPTNAYVSVTNQASLKTSTFHIAARATTTYKLKFTIWGTNNANTLVRVNRIFGTIGDGYPKPFLNTESDNKVFGDLIFGDATKGIQMRSDDGSYWKAKMGNDGVLTWVKQ